MNTLVVESGKCLLTVCRYTQFDRRYTGFKIGHQSVGFVSWSVSDDSPIKAALQANLEHALGIGPYVPPEKRTQVEGMPVHWEITNDPEGETQNLTLIFSWEWSDMQGFTQLNKGTMTLTTEDAMTLRSTLLEQ